MNGWVRYFEVAINKALHPALFGSGMTSTSRMNKIIEDILDE